MNERLARQIAFLVEADKLKSIIRRTSLVDLSRRENSAEHSWHLVLVIMVMREYGPPDVDWMRVMEMVAVHDLVEIDAGDVSAYNVDASKAVREQALNAVILAPTSVFGPNDHGPSLLGKSRVILACVRSVSSAAARVGQTRRKADGERSPSAMGATDRVRR